MSRLRIHARSQWLTLGAFALGVWILAGGCSTTELPEAPPPPPIPPLLTLPQPAGSDLSDIRDLFFAKGAPTFESLKECDAPFRKLLAATSSREELAQGVRELVRHQPEKMHWCYYGQLLRLEIDLHGDLYVDERQKRTLDTYEFVTPVARAFLTEFKDSRYLRTAVYRYRHLSEWVFFRRVDLTPKATSELVEASNPWGLLRGTGDQAPILEKYNLLDHKEPWDTGATPPAGTVAAPSSDGMTADGGIEPLWPDQKRRVEAAESASKPAPGATAVPGTPTAGSPVGSGPKPIQVTPRKPASASTPTTAAPPAPAAPPAAAPAPAPAPAH